MTYFNKHIAAAISATIWLNIAPVFAEDLMTVRFIDVGDATCALANTPNGQMVFLSGEDKGDHCLNSAKTAFAGNVSIDLLLLGDLNETTVLSTMRFLNTYSVKTLVHSGKNRHFAKHVKAHKGIVDFDFSKKVKTAYPEFPVGDATLTLTLTDSAEKEKGNFAASLSYGNVHILLLSGSDKFSTSKLDVSCAEAKVEFGEDHAALLDADIILVPSNDTASSLSTCLIETISPYFVVFSAGHGAGKPLTTVVNRFLGAGVKHRNILRTDRGDNEGGDEWSNDFTLPTCSDGTGDDSIIATITKSGEIKVAYEKPFSKCGELDDEQS